MTYDNTAPPTAKEPQPQRSLTEASKAKHVNDLDYWLRQAWRHGASARQCVEVLRAWVAVAGLAVTK